MRPPVHGLIVLAATLASVAGGGPERARAESAPDAVAAAVDSSGAAAPDALAPTSAPPWNPPNAMPVVRPWEAVLRLPGRVVTMPLSALGRLTRGSLLVVEGNNLVPRAI